MTYIQPKAKLFQHLDRLRAIKEGKRPAPVNVEIDLSNRCDLKCAGCHFAYTHTRGPWAGHADKPDGAIAGGDLMDTELAWKILTQLKQADVKSITWTGGGEPTLHPRFDSITHYADSLGLEQGIYTHGGFVQGNRARWMKENFTWIYISFDAHDAESYRSYKGVDRFWRVCENVRDLAAMPGKATVGMGFLLHSGNYQHVYSMQQLARELGVNYAQFRPAIHYSNDAPGALVEDTAWLNEAIALLGQYAGNPFVIADVDRFKMYRDWRNHGYETCYWSALQTVITPNGKLWRCTNKRERADGLLGDLATETFADVWARSGGPCAVNEACRVLCIGHMKNLTLGPVMEAQPHANFI